jgi:hypothetical protein
MMIFAVYRDPFDDHYLSVVRWLVTIFAVYYELDNGYIGSILPFGGYYGTMRYS